MIVAVIDVQSSNVSIPTWEYQAPRDRAGLEQCEQL